jgi:hypothetical protein
MRGIVRDRRAGRWEQAYPGGGDKSVVGKKSAGKASNIVVGGTGSERVTCRVKQCSTAELTGRDSTLSDDIEFCRCKQSDSGSL